MGNSPTRLGLTLRRTVLVLALGIYATVLWQITLTGTVAAGHASSEVNLVPFRTIIETITSPLGLSLIHI